jgi:hypothetical protein
MGVFGQIQDTIRQRSSMMLIRRAIVLGGDRKAREVVGELPLPSRRFLACS